HLVAAARDFLEARRRCLVVPLAHAELGALSWLLDPGGPAAHVRRVSRTAGADSGLLLYAGQVALLDGDQGLAARWFRRALRAGEGTWEEVADAADEGLPPELILDEVIPEDRARFALRFAERLYPDPANARHRERFLRRAAEGMPADLGLPPADRL